MESDRIIQGARDVVMALAEVERIKNKKKEEEVMEKEKEGLDKQGEGSR